MFDFQRAFKFFKNDSDWGPKFVTGSFLLLIPTLLSYIQQYLPTENSKLMMKYMPILLPAIVISLLLSALIAGYRVKLINREIIQNDLSLPSWGTFAEYFFLAVKAALGTAIWLIAGAIVCFLVFLPFGASFGSNPVLIIIPILLISAVVIGLLVILPLLHASYCIDLKFSAFFNMQRLKKLICGNVLKYFIYGVILFALSALQQILAFLFGITVIGILIVPFLVFYFLLVNADITAQFILQTGVLGTQNQVSK